MKKLLTLAALVAAFSLLIATWPAEPARAAAGFRPGMMHELMLPQTAASVSTGFTADRLNKFTSSPGCPVAGYLYYDTTADTVKACNNALSAVAVLQNFPLTAVDANTVKQANSTNAQTFQVFNTDDGAGNTEFAEVGWSSNALNIRTNKAGTGTARQLNLGTGGANRLFISAGGGTFGATTDNAVDFGTSGSTRPKNYYAATSFTLESVSNGAQWVRGYATELLTLSTGGATTDTAANLLPANAVIEAVVVRVTTTITTATDWSVGDPTTGTRFCSANATLVSGTTSVCLNHMSGAVTTLAAGPSQAAAAKVRITTTGTPGAGAIRITVFYHTFTAPTS